ncbi:unnamed protein product [Medioppia subpectinata]|uniref:Ribosomal protein L7Ae/L30e/S12e/Gadd45 domain-containing protein n=1 Tax=Medioppia subpectinata TaxID=1979941 RepID=A0A7R9KD60_9ACAR|nr:unnamed protein product [Medioppia subpectinata]CAG2101071.1 unnamed protein product [Medioppia subpectinata]
MEVKTTRDDANEDKSHHKTNAKKKKTKDKKRLMTLLRGPKRDHKLSYCMTEEESNDFKQTFTHIMDENSCLKLHPKTPKGGTTVETKSQTTSDLKLKNDMIFGINSVIRSIEKNCINGVILNNPLALPLVDNIMELCSDHHIPCLTVHSLDQLKTSLNISSLSAIGFKPNIASNESIFYRLYQFINNLILKNCSPIESNERQVKTEDKEGNDKSCEESNNLEPNKSELTFDKKLLDILYSKKSDDNYQKIMAKHLDTKSVSDNTSTVDDISLQESFLSFSAPKESYFPEINAFNKTFKIEIILDEKQTKGSDDSFAKSLFDSNDESDKKGSKRKLSQEKAYDSLDFKSPQIVRLEASTDRRQQRNKRKQTKKFKNK